MQSTPQEAINIPNLKTVSSWLQPSWSRHIGVPSLYVNKENNYFFVKVMKNALYIEAIFWAFAMDCMSILSLLSCKYHFNDWYARFFNLSCVYWSMLKSLSTFVYFYCTFLFRIFKTNYFLFCSNFS